MCKLVTIHTVTNGTDITGKVFLCTIVYITLCPIIVPRFMLLYATVSEDIPPRPFRVPKKNPGLIELMYCKFRFQVLFVFFSGAIFRQEEKK